MRARHQSGDWRSRPIPKRWSTGVADRLLGGTISATLETEVTAQVERFAREPPTRVAEAIYLIVDLAGVRAAALRAHHAWQLIVEVCCAPLRPAALPTRSAACPTPSRADGRRRRAFSDYKALVCVFLFGGNDSWNMVVPRSSAEYDATLASRQSLAIDQAALLPITAGPETAAVRLSSEHAAACRSCSKQRGARSSPMSVR